MAAVSEENMEIAWAAVIAGIIVRKISSDDSAPAGSRGENCSVGSITVWRQERIAGNVVWEGA